MLVCVICDEIIVRKRTGANCFIAGRQALKWWPKLLAAALPKVVEKATVLLGRPVIYIINYASEKKGDLPPLQPIKAGAPATTCDDGQEHHPSCVISPNPDPTPIAQPNPKHNPTQTPTTTPTLSPYPNRNPLPYTYNPNSNPITITKTLDPNPRYITRAAHSCIEKRCRYFKHETVTTGLLQAPPVLRTRA